MSDVRVAYCSCSSEMLSVSLQQHCVVAILTCWTWWLAHRPALAPTCAVARLVVCGGADLLVAETEGALLCDGAEILAAIGNGLLNAVGRWNEKGHS